MRAGHAGPLAIAGVLIVAACAVWAQPTAVAPAEINPGLGAFPPEVNRRSPAETWQSFLSLADQKAYARAAHLLDLSEVKVADQRRMGEEVAEQLAQVLGRLRVRRDAVADPAPAGAPPTVVAVRFERAGIAGEIALRRLEDPGGSEHVWLFSPSTVSSVPFWFKVLIKGEVAESGEPINPGLGPAPVEVRRGTPREALAGYFNAWRTGQFGLAAHYLDLSGVPSELQAARGARLARRLNLALQRLVWVDLSLVSNAPLGSPEAGVPEDQETFATVKVGHHPLELRLRHLWDRELGNVWLISPETVAWIDRIYARHGYGWVGDHAPVMLFAVQLGGLQLWQWLALLAGIAAGWVVSRWLGRRAVRVAERLAARTSSGWDDAMVRALDGPAALVIWALVLLAVSPWLGFSPAVRTFAFTICKLLAVSGIGWLLLRLVDVTVDYLRTARADNQVGVGFLPILARFGKVLVLAILVLAALDVVGVNVVGVLAGLGLGGIAIAFAAQKTIENMFGAASIAGDRAFQVGDFVSIGSDLGTVEDVGLRSTRLRTLARTVVTIPNGVVVAGRVENFTARDRILFNPTVGVVYGTSAEQLRTIRDGIKRRLEEHPRVHQPDHRVRFRSFGDSSLNIEVLCWVATREFAEFLEVAEELNFAIAEEVERAGSSFAFPTRTVVMHNAERVVAGG